MNINDRLMQILSDEYKLPAEKLLPGARLEDLGIDSLGVMELLFAIEDAFDIQVPNDQVELATIGDLTNYIQRLVVEQKAGMAAPQAGS